MAVALSLALVVGIAELLNIVAAERRVARQYAAAVAEAGNLMEEIVSRPWDETSAEQVSSISLSPAASRRLPDAKLSVDSTEEEDGVRRIRVTIDWRTPSGGRHKPVRLVGWKFRQKEDRP